MTTKVWDRGECLVLGCLSALMVQSGWPVRAAVEPEGPWLDRAEPQQVGRRPGIRREACPDRVLIRCLDRVQGLRAVADRPADDEEPVIDQTVHEGGVRIPVVLFPDRPRRVPAWPVDRPHREVGHAWNVRAGADIGPRGDTRAPRARPPCAVLVRATSFRWWRTTGTGGRAAARRRGPPRRGTGPRPR